MNVDSDRQRTSERNAGLLLIAAAIFAVIAGNGPFAPLYQDLLHLKVGPDLPRVGQIALHHWIADGLMAVFFLLVGLEVKREWYDGRLSTPADRRLPILAAAAGMAVPALIYLTIAGSDEQLRNGWAIPAATDIAFAIGVLALLGRRVPASIKLLLVTIAVIDDIGAIIIIALFYTADLNIPALAAALVVAGGMGTLGQFGVRRLWPFMAGFALLWILMLASGVHATVAGVLTAFTIPLGRGEARSPLKRLEHDIHPWVMFGIVPLFGFSSAGVELSDGLGTIVQPLPLAILAGLFIGKQAGILGAIWLAEKLGIAARPDGANWLQLYGASLLCGIGFTMSLFIGALAFPASPQLVEAAKVGILAGSLLSAVAGFLVLRFSPVVASSQQEIGEEGELFAADEDR